MSRGMNVISVTVAFIHTFENVSIHYSFYVIVSAVLKVPKLHGNKNHFMKRKFDMALHVNAFLKRASERL